MPCIKKTQYANAANAYSDEEDFSYDQFDCQDFDVDDNMVFNGEDMFFGRDEHDRDEQHDEQPQKNLPVYSITTRSWADEMEEEPVPKVMVQLGQQVPIPSQLVEPVKTSISMPARKWNEIPKPSVLTMTELESEAREDSLQSAARFAKEKEQAEVREQKRQEKLRKENESRAAIQYAEQKNKRDAYYRKSYAQRESIEKPKNPTHYQQSRRESVRQPVQAPTPKSVISKNAFALLEEE